MRSGLASYAWAMLLWAPPLMAGEGAHDAAIEPVYPTAQQLDQCLVSHEKARLEQLQGALFDARETLGACVSLECSASIHADCAAWLAEVEQAIPTAFVVLDGTPGEGASVLVDGSVTSFEALSAALELPPGAHVLRLEQRESEPVEMRFVLAQGQKGQVVRASWPAAPPAPTSKPPGRPSPESHIGSSEMWRRPSASAADAPGFWDGVSVRTRVLGAGAVVGIGVSVALVWSALSQKERAERTCAPLCYESVSSSIDQKLLWADVSGALGLLLGGLAIGDYVSGAAPAVPQDTEPQEER